MRVRQAIVHRASLIHIAAKFSRADTRIVDDAGFESAQPQDAKDCE
jgi:hypothetical protein